MEITYLGHSSFKLRGRDASLVTDPYDPEMVGIKFPKVEADIVTVSHDHKDHNFTEAVSKAARVISGPGEYEVKGVSVFGFPSYHDKSQGSERGKNTIYLIEMDGINLVHLGDLGHTLSGETVDEIGAVDILFLPIGGIYTIGPEDAVAVLSSLEPKIIIPMHYKRQDLNMEVFAKLETLESFISLAGIKNEVLPKLSIKKEEIGEEQKLICLTSCK